MSGSTHIDCIVTREIQQGKNTVGGSGNGTVNYYLIDVHNRDYPKQTRYHRKNDAFPVQRRTDFKIVIQKFTGTFFPGNVEIYSRLILMVAMHYILSYGSTTSHFFLL